MSCSCNKKDNPVNITIDKMKLMQGDTNAVSLFAFALNPVGFERALMNQGIEFGDNPLQDIQLLSNLHDSGGDVAGLMEGDDGKPIVFDYIKLIKTIPVDAQSSSHVKIEMV